MTEGRLPRGTNSDPLVDPWRGTVLDIPAAVSACRSASAAGAGSPLRPVRQRVVAGPRQPPPLRPASPSARAFRRRTGTVRAAAAGPGARRAAALSIRRERRAPARRGSVRRASLARRRCRSSPRRSGVASRAQFRSAGACRLRRRSARSSGRRSERRQGREGAHAGRARRGLAPAGPRGFQAPTRSPSPSRPEPLPMRTRPSGVVRK